MGGVWQGNVKVLYLTFNSIVGAVEIKLEEKYIFIIKINYAEKHK